MHKKCIAITIIAVVVIGAGMFYGGTMYEKNSLQKQGAIRGGGSGSSFAGGQSGQGRGGRTGAGANGQNGAFANGQIIAQDSSSITIKSQDGSSKIVYFSGSTSIGKTVSGTAADLSSGEQVTVTGTSNSDGSIAAQNIQIRPASPNQAQTQAQNQ